MTGLILALALIANGAIAAPRSAPDDRPGLTGVPLAREVVEGPGAPIPLSGGPWEARVRLGRGGTVAALAAPLIANGAIGTPLLGGTASHVGTQYGPAYLALPEHEWGQPGLLVRVTGAGGSVVRRSTDAGPDLQRQREGRVVDLNKWDFDKVCGVAPGEPDPGLCAVTVEYLADVPLPATDTAEPQP